MVRDHRPGILLLATLVISLGLAGCGDVTPTAESTSVEEHFRQGNDYAQAGDFEKAIAEYLAVLELDPENVSAMANLGVVYYSSGQLDKAIAQYESALAVAPTDADILSNLAAAYVQTGEFDTALEKYQKAVELNPDLPEAYFGLGVIYLQTGHTEEAIQAFEKFQELDTGTDPIASDQAEQYLQQLRGQ